MVWANNPILLTGANEIEIFDEVNFENIDLLADIL
jgi:hypothetical protein